MDENALANEETVTSEQTLAEKTYTQKEFDDAMARMRTSVTKKALKPYEELGTLDELRDLKEKLLQSNQPNTSQTDFENILKDLALKKDQEIQKRDQIIADYKIDSPLTAAAAKLRSVNPEQVVKLLKPSIKLNSDNEVEVLDTRGQVRYNDRGELFGVDDLVREFLDSNPHFVQPTPSTTSSRSTITHQGSGPIDLTQLDFKNPEHRKIYADAKKNGQL